MDLSAKAAYIKGLIDGLGLDDSTKEGKVILAMNEMLGEMAAFITEMDDDVSQLYDEVDEINEDLDALVEDLYEDDDEEDEDDEEDADEDYEYEITCTKCGAVNLANEDVMFSGETLYCAGCNEPLDFAYEADELDDEDKE